MSFRLVFMVKLRRSAGIIKPSLGVMIMEAAGMVTGMRVNPRGFRDRQNDSAGLRVLSACTVVWNGVVASGPSETVPAEGV